MDDSGQAASEAHIAEDVHGQRLCSLCGGTGPEVEPGWIPCKQCSTQVHLGCTGASGDQGWECSPCRKGPDLGALAAQLRDEAPLLESERRTFQAHDIFLKLPKVAERGQHELSCYEVLRQHGAQGEVAAMCWGAVVVRGQQILVLEQLDPLTDQEFIQEVPTMLACLKTFHKAGVLAGDIKPEHLMRRREGAKGVVVVDLDLACFRGKLPPGAAGRPTSRLFKEYIITPNAVATATFMGTLRYAALSAHLGLAPTEVGDLVCLLFSLWHKRAGLPWSRLLDNLVQNCLNAMDSKKQRAAKKSTQQLKKSLTTTDEEKQRAAEKKKEQATAELKAWFGGLRKKTEGEFLQGLYADFKLGLLGTGKVHLGDKLYEAEHYNVGSLTLEDVRGVILEAEAAAHAGQEGVKRGLLSMTELILKLAKEPSSITQYKSPGQKHQSKEGQVVAGGVRVSPDGSKEPSEADNGVPQPEGDSEMSSTSRLARLGGLSTTELENRLQEATAEAEEEMRDAVGSVLGVGIETRTGKLVRESGAYPSTPAGILRASPQLLALRPATTKYEIDGFGRDNRPPEALFKALSAAPADSLGVSHIILHPTGHFPPELRVRCGGESRTEARGTDILMEAIASGHPKSIAANYGQTEAGICMVRRHPLSLSLQPALLLVAFVGKPENVSSVQESLSQEAAGEVLPYCRYASLLGWIALVQATTPRAIKLAKKVKRRQENLRNTSTLASLYGSDSGGRLAPADIVEVRLHGSTDDPIELQRPASIAALKEKCCEVFHLHLPQIERLRISSLRSPDAFNKLNDDWQLKRQTTSLIEVVLTEQTYGPSKDSQRASSSQAPALEDLLGHSEMQGESSVPSVVLQSERRKS